MGRFVSNKEPFMAVVVAHRRPLPADSVEKVGIDRRHLLSPLKSADSHVATLNQDEFRGGICSDSNLSRASPWAEIAGRLFQHNRPEAVIVCL